MRLEDVLLEDERVLTRIQGIGVNRKKGYSGFVTDRRLIFLSRTSLIESPHRAVETITWERRRVLGVWPLIIASFLVLFFLGLRQVSLLLVVAIFLFWHLYRTDALVLHMRDRHIAITGEKEDLLRLMKEVRRGERGVIVMGVESAPAVKEGPRTERASGFLRHFVEALRGILGR